MTKIKNQKTWNPKNSFYQEIIVNKYLKQGYSQETANRLARKEWEKSIKLTVGFYN